MNIHKTLSALLLFVGFFETGFASEKLSSSNDEIADLCASATRFEAADGGNIYLFEQTKPYPQELKETTSYKIIPGAHSVEKLVSLRCLPTGEAVINREIEILFEDVDKEGNKSQIRDNILGSYRWHRNETTGLNEWSSEFVSSYYGFSWSMDFQIKEISESFFKLEIQEPIACPSSVNSDDLGLKCFFRADIIRAIENSVFNAYWKNMKIDFINDGTVVKSLPLGDLGKVASSRLP
jgi:hypothetical protein